MEVSEKTSKIIRQEVRVRLPCPLKNTKQFEVNAEIVDYLIVKNSIFIMALLIHIKWFFFYSGLEMKEWEMVRMRSRDSHLFCGLPPSSQGRNVLP